jgi:hypothetical protein
LNWSAVIQRFFSTNIRRVQGKVPPNPETVIQKKAKNRSAWLGIDGAVGGGEDFGKP